MSDLLQKQKEIMNLFYDDVGDLLDFKTYKEKSVLHAFCSFYPQYDGKVGNGGHYSFFNDQYHTDQVCSDNSIIEDCSILNFFIECTEELYKETNIESLNKLLTILHEVSEFSIDTEDYIDETCDTCDNGEVYNEDIEDYESCDDCEGKGYNEIDNENLGHFTEGFLQVLDWNDTAFYKISDTIYKDIADYIIKKKLHDGVYDIIPELIIRDKLEEF